MSLRDRAEALLRLYEGTIRNDLVALECDELPGMDAAADVLRRALAAPQTLRIGFLGESQVGKSSIINALLGRRVLPSGGVGPLTAQATTVAFSAEPALRIRYHGRKRINEFRFALSSYLKRLGELEVDAGVPDATPGDMVEDDLQTYGRLDFDDVDGTSPTEKRHSPRGDSLVEQARKLFDAPDAMPSIELLQLVRALAQKEEDAADVAGPFCDRMRELRSHLDGEERLNQAATDRKTFLHALRLRATGYLAPLVDQLHVTLEHPLLAAAELVDLPGVGVVGDPAGQTAETFVRTHGDALVLVMRNNGLTEQIADLLEQTGVITKLLFGGRDGRPAVHVAIVVTRLDDVAKDEYAKKYVDAQDSGDPLPHPGEIFQSLAQQMAVKIRSQVGDALLRSRSFDDLEPDQRRIRERVVRDLCGHMTVVCVAAPDYLALAEQSPVPRLLQSAEDTNIPALSAAIAELARAANEARTTHLTEAEEQLHSILDRTLATLESARRDRKGVREEADLQFRAGLEQVADPLRQQAKQHRREFMKFLGEAMPNSLDALADRAADNAKRRLQRLKKEGAKIHWATLNAALTRGGEFSAGKKDVNYPGSLTYAFVDIVAGSWRELVIDVVRAEVKRLCDNDEQLIIQLNDQAAALLAGDDDRAVLLEQRRLVREQAKTAVSWTKGELDALSDEVRQKLSVVVRRPIEKACKKAKDEGRNRGEGARNQILEVFDESGTEAIDKARDACFGVLDGRLDGLRKSLGQVLRESHDPVSLVLEHLAGQKAEQIVALSDERRRAQLKIIQKARRSFAPRQGNLPSAAGDAAGVAS